MVEGTVWVEDKVEARLNKRHVDALILPID